MRFVTPEVVRIPLKPGPGGEQNWIEVKKELSVGEEKRFRSAGFRQMSQGEGKTSINVDWADLALARVNAYLVDWSATETVNGRPVPVKVTRDAIEALSQSDFDEIDQAVQSHIAAQEAEKKPRAGAKN